LIGLQNEIYQWSDAIFLESGGLAHQDGWRLIWLKGKKLSPVAQAYWTLYEPKSRKY